MASQRSFDETAILTLHVRGPHGTRYVPLGRDATTLGRGEGNDVQVLEPQVSKRHAVIRRENGQLVLSDVGSKAGVYCNGRRVQRCVLQRGDEIVLGPSSATTILLGTKDATTNLLTSFQDPPTGSVLDRLARFLEVSREIAGLAAEDVLATVVDVAIETTRADRGCVILVAESGDFEFRAVRGPMGQPIDDASPVVSASTVRQVLDERRPKVVADVALDPALAMSHSVMSLKLRSVVAIPLRRLAAGREVFGVLYLDSGKRRDAFGDLDVGILETLARDASSAIENARLMHEAEEKRRMDRELARAKEVQSALVPDAYWSEPFFDVAGSFVPCLELGGDYLGQFRLADGRAAFVVADVCGKGVQAALLAAALQGALETAFETEPSLPRVVAQANRVISRLTPVGKFISLVCCSLDASGELRWVSAGHCPIVVVRASGVEQLETGGIALGPDPDAGYDECAATLNRGDAVILYSDGVSEALDERRELFGDDRLVDAVRAGHDADAATICDRLLASIEAFRGNAPLADDTTVMAVVYRG